MPSKPGRPPVKTSFKPGNKAALGNDKTLNLSTWLKRELEKTTEYDQKMTIAKEVAASMIETLRTTKDVDTKLDYFKEISDRTEGKPKQSTSLENPDGTRLFEKITFTINQDN